MTNHESSLARFDNDGLELFINTKTGESFASQRGLARMTGVSETAIRKWIASNSIVVQRAEVLTQTGLQGANLLDETAIGKALAKYNPELLLQCMQAGIRVYLHRQAGFQFVSTAQVDPMKDLEELKERFDNLEGHLKDTLDIIKALVESNQVKPKTKAKTPKAPKKLDVAKPAISPYAPERSVKLYQRKMSIIDTVVRYHHKGVNKSDIARILRLSRPTLDRYIKVYQEVFSVTVP